MKEREAQFTKVWETEAPRVMAFAARHVGADTAQDVVAETFMTAWRKWDVVPDPAIGWLITTARHVIWNRTRTTRRQRALEERIALLDSVAAHGNDLPADCRREALEQLAKLTEEHREALLLVSWDGLTPVQAAEALGIRPATFRKRLSRARAVLTGDSPANGSLSQHTHQTLTIAPEAS